MMRCEVWSANRMYVHKIHLLVFIVNFDPEAGKSHCLIRTSKTSIRDKKRFVARC